MIARTPGGNVRSLGGLGQFSSVSLRGSSAQQVAVFLDGVPIGAGFAGLLSLSDQPLDALTRVEIHRGHVPVKFGGATIGGAINLVSRPGRDASRATVDIGYGSFDARHTPFATTVPVGKRVSLTTRIGYAGAGGEFEFLDPGTPQNPDDDATARRVNNHYDRVLGQLRVDARRGHWRIAAQELVTWKAQGVPGPVGAPAQSTDLSTIGARTIVSVRRTRLGRPGGQFAWVFGLGGQHRVFRDPDDELGVAVDDQLTRSIDTYLSPRLRLALWRGAFLGLVGDQRTEWVDTEERAGMAMPSGDATRLRLSYGAGLELEQFLYDRRLLIVPVIRADAIDSRFQVPAGEGEQDDDGRDDLDVGFSPRLGLRAQLTRWLQLRASLGRYYRPPTLLELFGDRGYIVGNEGLRAETGMSVDGGFVLDLQRRDSAGVYAQIAGFYTRSEDLIQWINAGAVTRPENVASARIAGLETGVDVRAPHRIAILTANYTFLDTRNEDSDPERNGEALPGRPAHDLFTRLSLGHEWVARQTPLEPRVFYTFELVASTFLDPSGRFELPARAFHGAGAELHAARRVHVAVEVRNLLDNRTADITLPVAGGVSYRVPLSDFIGYPLPGRSVWATLRVDMDLPRPRRSRT